MKVSSLFKRMTALVIVIAVLAQPVLAAETYKNRDDIPAKYKWDLTHIYKTEADLQKDADLLEKKLIPKIASYKGKLNTKEDMLGFLETDTEVGRILKNIFDYVTLNKDVDPGNENVLQLYGKALNLGQKAEVASSFFIPELHSRDVAEIKAYISDPDFKDYALSLELILKEKKHSGSEEQEELLSYLSIVSQSPSDIYTTLSYIDLEYPSVKDSKGNTVEITSGNFGVLMENPDRDFRKSVYEAYYGEYLKYSNTFAATLSSMVNFNIFFAKAHNYDSAMEAALSPDIPVSVYNNLIESANKGLEPLIRYKKLAQEVLGIEDFRPYDGYMPLVEGQNKVISYEEAKKIVLKALAPLGKDYIAVLNKAFDENWIDVYETPGKATGAYSAGVKAHPYVLLNYSESFYDVSTLAHELGHAVHQYYSNNEQPITKGEVTAFTSEVASTLNEILLHKYMIKNAKTNDEKLYYMISLINLYSGTFYSQARNAEFEKAIYEAAEEGDTLTAEMMNSLWNDLAVKYNTDNYEIDEYAAASWAGIPHFYYNFYVYQYATSIAAASALADGIIENKPGALKKYLEFLKSGSQYDSITTLANVGVDMNSPKMLDTLVNEFDSLVTETERLLRLEGKIK